MLLLTLLSCIPQTAPSSPLSTDAPVYIDRGPGEPRLCLSPVPDAGRLKGESGAWSDAAAYMKAGDLVQAAAVLDASGAHPGLQALRGGLALMQGDPAARGLLRDLAIAWPEDACLQQALALVYLESRESALAQTAAADALHLRPDDPDALYLYGLAQLKSGEVDRAIKALRDALTARPGHPGASYILGNDYLDRGHVEMALPLLEDALAGGLDVSGALAEAYFTSGRTADYVRIASLAKWPMGDGGVIGTSDDPMAAWMAVLGVAEGQDLVAIFETSMGEITCTLYWQQAPLTVSHFVALARGGQPWLDTRTNTQRTDPLYTDTIFHRVIPGFMIQGGDPLGTGAGGPGYRFHDEIDPELTFEGPGVLAMANAGPDTNGSQFFITDAPAPHLNGKHTIFGHCDEAGQEVVAAIARVPAQQTVPVEAVALHQIRIEAR